jgi:hypothetical protein
MAVLQPTEIVGQVTWLGLVRDRDASLCSEAVARVDAEFSGFRGEAHAGLVRPSCSRVREQYPIGPPIRNTRQVSIVSVEELDLISKAMGIEAVEPDWLGASMVVEGIPDLTCVPPSSRLIFEGGASICVDMENAPCLLPARVIEDKQPGFGKLFKAAAQGRRGVVGWIEAEGSIGVGEQLRLHVPRQRAYPALRR